MTGPHYKVKLRNLLLLLRHSPGGPNGISDLGTPALEDSLPAKVLHLVNALMMIQKTPDSFSQQ